jgi:hypothetical protein
MQLLQNLQQLLQFVQAFVQGQWLVTHAASDCCLGHSSMSQLKPAHALTHQTLLSNKNAKQLTLLLLLLLLLFSHQSCCYSAL